MELFEGEIAIFVVFVSGSARERHQDAGRRDDRNKGGEREQHEYRTEHPSPPAT
jgi:hypothetical protein